MPKYPIGRNKIIFFYIFLDYVRLHLRPSVGTFRNKADIIKMPVWVYSVVDRVLRNSDLIPGQKSLIPEYGSPCFVKFIESTVFFFEKHPKSLCITLGIKNIGLAVKLIVYLPTYNTLPFSIVRCKSFHYTGGILLINR